jgi:hypothetical protein
MTPGSDPLEFNEMFVQVLSFYHKGSGKITLKVWVPEGYSYILNNDWTILL